MAGRPRTKAKRVRRLLVEHQRLTEELQQLGKHHLPAPGEPWDLTVHFDADPMPTVWRNVAHSLQLADWNLEVLAMGLEMKAEQMDQAAKSAGGDAAKGNEGDRTSEI